MSFKDLVSKTELFAKLAMNRLAQSVPNSMTSKPTQPQSGVGSVQPIALPPEAEALLAPYKGKKLMHVTLNGNDLSVIYDMRRMSNTSLQNKLRQALPGYNVSVMGKTEMPGSNY